MPNPFTYTELHTSDPSRAQEFYRRLFDWKFDAPAPTPSGPYVQVHPGAGNEAGLMKTAARETSHWLSYIRVDDIEASVRKAGELGGTLLGEIGDVPDAGRFAWLVDPTGAHFGLFQPTGK